MYNKEQTSKLVSYWLRHNPSDGNLDIDEFGWVSIDNLLNALNSRGQNLTYSDIAILNQSFDKIRWEFNDDRIRASHGHSISVILEDKNATPPLILYHGTASKNVTNILKYGLLTMQRQFVHCSANIETAIEVGKRHGKPIVVEVDTESYNKNNARFFQTSDNVWLTSEISNEFLSFKPWETVVYDEKKNLLKQLETEVSDEHIVFKKISNFELILRRHDCDDCLFIDNTDLKVYLIHLTFQGKQLNLNYPRTRLYASFNEWVQNKLIEDQKNWYCI